MEENPSKDVVESNRTSEKKIIRTASCSSSDDYELVDSNITENVEKVAHTPVLESLASQELINDAMINSPSSNNVLVGKSIFYDCLDEKSKSEKLSDTDEGKIYSTNIVLSFFCTFFVQLLLLLFYRCSDI
jgi:hypothetical protein